MSTNKAVQTLEAKASSASQTTETTSTTTKNNPNHFEPRPQTPEPRHPFMYGAIANAAWNAKTPTEQKLDTDKYSLWYKENEAGLDSREVAIEAWEICILTTIAADHDIGFRDCPKIVASSIASSMAKWNNKTAAQQEVITDAYELWDKEVDAGCLDGKVARDAEKIWKDHLWENGVWDHWNC